MVVVVEMMLCSREWWFAQGMVVVVRGVVARVVASK
jgi:hypothetical protein